MRIVKRDEWEMHHPNERFVMETQDGMFRYWVNTPLPRLPDGIRREDVDTFSILALQQCYWSCTFGNQAPTAIRCVADTWARMLAEFAMKINLSSHRNFSQFITPGGQRVVRFSFEGCPFVIADEHLHEGELFFLNEPEWNGNPGLHAILTVKEWQ